MGRPPFLTDDRDARDPVEFNKSLIASNAINTTTYVITAVLGFYLAGRSVDPFVLNSVAAGPLKIVATCCLALHLVLAYVLCGQPLHIVIHEIVSPSTAHAPTWKGQLVRAAPPPAPPRLGGRVRFWTDSTRLLQTQRHFLITSVVLVDTFVIGNVIPFFKDLQVSASVGPRRLPSS